MIMRGKSKWVKLRVCCISDSDQCEPYDIPRGQLESKCGRNPGDTCNFFCDGGMMPKEGRLYCTKSHPHWDKYLANLCTGELFRAI